MTHQELTWRERGRLWLRISIRTALVLSIVILAYLLIPPFWTLFAPFILAFFMAWLLNPLIRGIQKRLRISRGILSLLLIILIFAALGGLITAFFWSAITEIQSFADNWQSVSDSVSSYVTNLQHSMDNWLRLLPPELVTTVNETFSNFLVWLKSAVTFHVSSFAWDAGSFVSAIPSFAVATIIFIMGTYFITADYPRLRFLFTDHLSPDLREFLSRVKTTASGALGGYVKAEFLLSVIVFFILIACFLITQQSYGVLLAAVIAVLDFIPIIGAGTVLVPWAGFSFFTGDYRNAIEMLVIWGVIVLFRRLAEPKIVGDKTGLSPILSLVSIYVGMRLGGILGMILGPVVTLVFLNILKMGTLTPFANDLKLAVNDCMLFLKRTPKSEPPNEAS